MVENAPQPSQVVNTSKIKYADPRSLPSFPSHGLNPDGAAASAAASLGWANQKPVELWKPEETSSASAAAASLAKDYRSSPVWEPTANSAGHRAAVLAVGSAGAALKNASNSDRTPRSAHEGWGNSAATQAFHAPRSSTVQESKVTHGNSAAAQAFHAPRAPTAQAPDVSHGNSAATQAFNISRTATLEQQNLVPDDSPRHRSLAAAKGAMSQNRPRAISSPAPAQAESSPAATGALSGAAIAHRASMQPKPASSNAGAVPVTTMTRNMFTSHPMVKPEVDERENNEKLHQSAVAMARKMYQQQQKMVEQAKGASTDGAGQGPQYLNLQDAAYKQAQERLAKLQTDHHNNRELQEYYGNAQPVRRRFSVANKLRRRSSSDGDMGDREKSDRIRQQMSLFSSKLSEVDKSKREKDREALLVAAQRNVKARLQGMDEKIYNDTGMVNPTLMDSWDTKAQEAAQARHETRTVNKGMIDIGGGKFMAPDEVDAIAAKRVQPVLDDIKEKADAERERVAIAKLDEETRKADIEKQKARDREIKEINKKSKEQDKQEEKAKKKQEKEDEKALKRQARDEKRRSKHEPVVAASSDPVSAEPTMTAPALELPVVAASTDPVSTEPAVLAPALAPPAMATSPLATENLGNDEPRVDTPEAGDVQGAETTQRAATPQLVTDENETGARRPGDSPSSPTSKVKGWIKNRFSRGKSVSEHGDKKKGFLGGASLRRDSEANASVTSLENRPSSIRDVAMAGRTEPARAATPLDSRGVSPVSDEDDEPMRSSGRQELAPPRPIEDPVARTSSSPTRDSRFREEMDR